MKKLNHTINNLIKMEMFWAISIAVALNFWFYQTQALPEDTFAQVAAGIIFGVIFFFVSLIPAKLLSFFFKKITL